MFSLPLKKGRVVSIYNNSNGGTWDLARLISLVQAEKTTPKGNGRADVDAAAGETWTVEWRFPGGGAATNNFVFSASEEQKDDSNKIAEWRFERTEKWGRR